MADEVLVDHHTTLEGDDGGAGFAGAGAPARVAFSRGWEKAVTNVLKIHF